MRRWWSGRSVVRAWLARSALLAVIATAAVVVCQAWPALRQEAPSRVVPGGAVAHYAWHWLSRDELSIPATLAAGFPSSLFVDAAALQRQIRVHGRTPQALLAAYTCSRAKALDLDLTEFRPDLVLADLGAGTGALEVRLLAERRPFARLWAIDWDASSIEVLRTSLEAARLPDRERVVAVVAQACAPPVPPRSLDVALIIDPRASCGGEAVSLLDCVPPLLKPGGALHYADPEDNPACGHDTLARELAARGFEWVTSRRNLPVRGVTHGGGPDHALFHAVFRWPGDAPSRPTGSPGRARQRQPNGRPGATTARPASGA